MDSLPDIFQNLLVGFLTFLPKLVVAIVILIVTLYIAGLASRLVVKALAIRKANAQVTRLLSQLVRWAILVLGLVTALQQVDFDVTGLVAGLGIAGFALGFALQDIAQNFVSGIILLIQQPFHAGDIIQTNGYTGRVLAVDLRTTELLTLDGEDVIIPNGKVLADAIKNISKTPAKRVSIHVGVAYHSDLEQVRKVACEAVRGIPGLLTHPAEPFLWFQGFGNSAIEMTVYFWIDSTKIHPNSAQDTGIGLLKTAFDQAGIEIPYPTQVVISQEARA